MKPIVCFGEIMARLQPPGHLRFRQVMPGMLELTFAGAEANAAVTIAALGGNARIVSTLPRHEVAEACLANLRAAKVGVEHVVRSDTGRLGLYFVEAGAAQRAGNVMYDRDGSSFGLAGPEAYDWSKILRGTSWLHTSGIAAAVSRASAEATVAAVTAAQAAGVPVSFDINHRRKLWRWDPTCTPEELARCTLARILPSVDLLLGNPADLAQAAGVALPAAEPESAAGREELAALARVVVGKFSRVQRVAMSLRNGVSATHQRCGALLYTAVDDQARFAPAAIGQYRPYEITHVVDRLGTGDALAGALLFALETPELAAAETAIKFAAAASCLAHSIPGDFNYVTRAEVEALQRGGTGGGVSR
jgi:2-dehydro-3-deoxygluconokinase